MTSLEILTVKKTIEDYLTSVEMPMELKRMIVKEIYEKVEKSAYAEAMQEVKERDDGENEV